MSGDALAALGGDAAEVAQSLIDRGYRGMPGRETHCPLARYLTDLTGERTYVYDTFVSVGGRTVYMPEAVRDFIAAYDDRLLPADLQLALQVDP